MEYPEFESLFTKSMQENSLEVPTDAVIQLFFVFDTLLHKTNAVTNLTAIRNTPDAITKHYADSLLASKYLPQGARVLDLGCGPGFPSIPLAIARHDLEIVALDSTAKKIAFVEQTSQSLGLGLTAIAGRAEDKAIFKKLGQFDVVTSRAVARMNILCELCLPYVKIGGKLLAMKAAKAEEEATEALNCIKTLGGSKPILHFETLTNLDGVAESRCLIEIAKVKPSPTNYPRAYAQIVKKPL